MSNNLSRRRGSILLVSTPPNSRQKKNHKSLIIKEIFLELCHLCPICQLVSHEITLIPCSVTLTLSVGRTADQLSSGGPREHLYSSLQPERGITAPTNIIQEVASNSNPKFGKPVKGRNSASNTGYRAVRAENGSDSPIISDICPVRQVDGLFEFRVGDVRGNAQRE